MSVKAVKAYYQIYITVFVKMLIHSHVVSETHVVYNFYIIGIIQMYHIINYHVLSN